MILTKYGHACVRISDGGRALVIDPGVFTEDAAFDGITDVLITHEHADHVDAKRLAGRDVNVYAPLPVVELLADEGVIAEAVDVGASFMAAGFSVLAVGGEHAEIFGGEPDCANLGFVLDEDVYHPGDSFFVPDLPVRTLLVPVSGPWLKLGEAIAFTRAIAPVRAFPIHDAVLSEIGNGLVDRWLTGAGETDYKRIPNGESIKI